MRAAKAGTWILWDFNGTLLDDAAYNLSVLNRMLSVREHPVLTMDAYRDSFGFPVRSFYQRVGLAADPESFDRLAREYMEHYLAGQHALRLRSGARTALAGFRECGCHQVLLSASSLAHLHTTLAELGIAAFFENVLGLTDIRAAGKTDIAVSWALSVQRTTERNRHLILIGDTVHDHEVAQALAGVFTSVSCVLVAGGHNSRRRLKRTGAVVADSIGDAVRRIQGGTI